MKIICLIILTLSVCDAKKYRICEVAKRLDEMKVSRSDIPICKCRKI